MIEPTRPGDEVPEPDLIAQRTPIEDTAEDTGTGTDGAELFFPHSGGRWLGRRRGRSTGANNHRPAARRRRSRPRTRPLTRTTPRRFSRR